MAAIPAMATLPSMRRATSTAQPRAEEQTAPRITTVAWFSSSADQAEAGRKAYSTASVSRGMVESIPYGGVILDSAGNLYGTTVIGGVDNGGVLFQLSQSGSGWTETVLHSFGGLNDGDGPVGGLIMDRQGNLYGTTASGPGYQNVGTVYELQPSGGSWTYSILPTSLSGFGGPEDALTMDAAGNLYATSYGGGSSTYGNVFRLTPSGGSWTYTNLHDFNGHDGADPYGSVVLDAHGNVYGTTSSFGYGEIWEITP